MTGPAVIQVAWLGVNCWLVSLGVPTIVAAAAIAAPIVVLAYLCYLRRRT